MKEIEFSAEIPSRKIGKTTTKPYVAFFNTDEKGTWKMKTSYCDDVESALEEEVIDICKNAKNWAEIRRLYFPMCGFHA